LNDVGDVFLICVVNVVNCSRLGDRFDVAGFVSEDGYRFGTVWSNLFSLEVDVRDERPYIGGTKENSRGQGVNDTETNAEFECQGLV